MRWVVKVGAKYIYVLGEGGRAKFCDKQSEALVFPTKASALWCAGRLYTDALMPIKNARVVKLVPKGSKAKKSLEGRVAVLEAQVRSLQVALPKVLKWVTLSKRGRLMMLQMIPKSRRPAWMT